MKTFERDILSFQQDLFFIPIRDKVDYARVLLNAARSLIIDYTTGNRSEVAGNFKLVIDKMSRLFFYTNCKFFSISFPFRVGIDQDGLIEIETYRGRLLDSKAISSSISILKNNQFLLKPSPIEYFGEIDGSDIEGLFLLEEIFQFEPAYIRYDNDPDNVNGNLHPLDHLDLNYSSYGTYKIGLKKAIDGSYFENIVNISTDCSFLTD